MKTEDQIFKEELEEEEYCSDCNSTKYWQDCSQCDDGYQERESPFIGDTQIYEVKCDICDGRGGWFRCFVCSPLQKGETL